MENQKEKSAAVLDERIIFEKNKYAANALIFLVYYLAISIVVKSFTFDINIFLYWDNAIAMVLGVFYLIYRSADNGVPVAPATTSILNKRSLITNSVVSVLFGLFIAFFISGMDERLSALLPGLTEKLLATLVIGGLFFLILTALLWLFDVLPTKLAFKRASELTGETEEKIPPMEDDVITESEFRDERIDSIINKYAAHAFYFLFGYIILSNMVKMLLTDVRLIVYYDAFIVATIASGYFLLSILKTGTNEDHEYS